mmetsp:Transcript_32967/g.97179  ORF Transcript_32967/g.97179 Transcript_32967/m.97179 type:complete len:658 (-) Transcript_32967:158-2131(-)
MVRGAAVLRLRWRRRWCGARPTTEMVAAPFGERFAQRTRPGRHARAWRLRRHEVRPGAASSRRVGRPTVRIRKHAALCLVLAATTHLVLAELAMVFATLRTMAVPATTSLLAAEGSREGTHLLLQLFDRDLVGAAVVTHLGHGALELLVALGLAAPRLGCLQPHLLRLAQRLLGCTQGRANARELAERDFALVCDALTKLAVCAEERRVALKHLLAQARRLQLDGLVLGHQRCHLTLVLDDPPLVLDGQLGRCGRCRQQTPRCKRRRELASGTRTLLGSTQLGGAEGIVGADEGALKISDPGALEGELVFGLALELRLEIEELAEGHQSKLAFARPWRRRHLRRVVARRRQAWRRVPRGEAAPLHQGVELHERLRRLHARGALAGRCRLGWHRDICLLDGQRAATGEKAGSGTDDAERRDGGTKRSSVLVRGFATNGGCGGGVVFVVVGEEGALGEGTRHRTGARARGHVAGGRSEAKDLCRGREKLVDEAAARARLGAVVAYGRGAQLDKRWVDNRRRLRVDRARRRVVEPRRDDELGRMEDHRLRRLGDGDVSTLDDEADGAREDERHHPRPERLHLLLLLGTRHVPARLGLDNRLHDLLHRGLHDAFDGLIRLEDSLVGDRGRLHRLVDRLSRVQVEITAVAVGQVADGHVRAG